MSMSFSPIGKISTEVSWTTDQAKPIAIFILLVKGFLIEGFMDGLQEEPMNCLKFMQNCE